MRIDTHNETKAMTRALLGAASLTAMTLGSVATAQDTATDEGDVIVVTGQRLSNQRAIDAKREAQQIIDAVAADDLNALPDQNLAEGLSRVPGLTAFQDEGAGLYVGVRGLNQEFVNLTIDGLEASSASRTFDNNLRGANLEAVPSTFVSTVEVIKAVTPDLDGDAIAGTVNLVTRSVFDTEKPWFTFGGAIGQYEEDVPFNDVDPSTKANVSLGTLLGENDQFGLVLDGNFRGISRDNLKPRAYFGSNGDGSELPDEVGGFFYEREEESYGLTGKVEFRDRERYQGFVSINYFDSQIDILKNKHAIFGAASDPVTGTFSGAVGTARNDGVEYGVDGSLTLAGALDVFVGDRDVLTVKASTSESTSYQDVPRVDWYFGGPLSGVYERDEQYYAYTFDAESQEAWVDPENYIFNGYRRFQEELDKQVSALRADWTRSATGAGLGYKAGFKWKETDIGYTASNIRWDRPLEDYGFEDALFVEDYQFPGTTNPQILMGDVFEVIAIAEGVGADGFGRQRSTIVNGNDYDITEAVLAGYGLLDYSSGSYRVVGGLRYEGTETEAFNRFDRADDADFVETSGDYGNWLPSAAFTYFVNDNTLLRLGASRTLGRPDVRDLARGETPPNDNGFFSRGNPDLEARKSTNLDASLEFYFDEGDSLFSVAVFRKDIEDEIFDLQTPYIYVNELDEEVDAFFTQPQNGGDASVSGIEIGFVKDSFGVLPAPLNNLGLSANMTINQGELDLLDEDGSVLRTVNPEGLSEQLANLTVYYEGPRLSARAAYRFVSEQSQALSADGSGDLLLDDYQQTDLKFGYKVNSRFELFGEVWNLFEDEQEFTNQNVVTGIPNWAEQVRYGRAVWVSLNVSR